MTHIIMQFISHYGWAIVLVCIIGYLIDYWSLHNRKAAQWLSTNVEPHLLMAALIVFAILPIRESYDAWMHNQTPIKTPFDYASWFLGAATGVWLVYRGRKWFLSRRPLS